MAETGPSASPIPVAADAWGDKPKQIDRRDALVVDVGGFEGPLDLLLALARTQKVDLTKISILALAEQYLAFISQAKNLRLELAADYLVIAAWLAYLKSRLLLPDTGESEEEPTGEELAAQLAFRLRRLEAMRAAADKLMARNRLGREVFARGNPEGFRVLRSAQYEATVFDLLKAYAQHRRRKATNTLRYTRPAAWAIKDARKNLERLLGMSLDWAPLDTLLVAFAPGDEARTTAIASTFGASLELAREGALELRQARPFAPLFMRRRTRTSPVALQPAQSRQS